MQQREFKKNDVNNLNRIIGLEYSIFKNKRNSSLSEKLNDFEDKVKK